MDHVHILKNRPQRPRRHVASVTAEWRELRQVARQDPPNARYLHWCTTYVLMVWQHVYEQDGRYFTGD